MQSTTLISCPKFGDHYKAPDQPIHSADIVNLGFVVNFIEVRSGWRASPRPPVIVRPATRPGLTPPTVRRNPRGQRFRDGVLTQRGTFQKYFTQAEIKAFIEAALDEEPIPVAPGVLYVFRDQEVEQRFLVDRYRNRLEVAQWIVTHTPFDRLYFYGADLPIHVSFGPNHDRQIVWMVVTLSGRRVPQVITREKFLALRSVFGVAAHRTDRAQTM